jgi:hypothetical protein
MADVALYNTFPHALLTVMTAMLYGFGCSTTERDEVEESSTTTSGPDAAEDARLAVGNRPKPRRATTVSDKHH